MFVVTPIVMCSFVDISGFRFQPKVRPAGLTEGYSEIATSVVELISNLVGPPCDSTIDFRSFVHSFIHLFIHSAICLTTVLQSLPKRFRHRVRCSASLFSFQYPVVSLRFSSGCLLLLPCLPVTVSFLAFLQ